MERKKLTPDRLRNLLRYDPITGLFMWLVSRGRKAKAGQQAGIINDEGYVAIKIDGVTYKGHRLAFFYVNGAWPDPEADHENGIRHDNRWTNLREATHAENMQNIAMPSTNTSGHIGVCWHVLRKKWQVSIRVDGVLHHVGYFMLFDDAVDAYKAARLRLNPFKPVARQDVA